jgi:hypothetical protein
VIVIVVAATFALFALVSILFPADPMILSGAPGILFSQVIIVAFVCVCGVLGHSYVG